MAKIVVDGWEPGFNKVGLNQLLRQRFEYSLGAAKRAVDELLENRHIVIEVPDAMLIEIGLKLKVLGVRFRY